MTLVGGICCVPGCRRPGPGPQEPPPSEVIDEKPADFLTFPDHLRVADASVNDFIVHAMTECAGGDYERFRLVWVATQEPIRRDEYDQGWQAVREITVRAVEQVVVETDASKNSAPSGLASKRVNAYALAAEVVFDPAHPAGKREPRRQVVLMLTREHDAWRLARPPKPMRKWLRDRVWERPSAPTPASGPARPAGSPREPSHPSRGL